MSSSFKKGLTFDDLLLLPDYSDCLPSEISIETHLHPHLTLQIPIISSAMDTVTERDMARLMAQMGGLGIIHKNMSIKSQATEVERVKKFESGIIQDPLTISPNHTVEEAFKIMKTHKISGLPVVVDNKLEGILTNRDLRFEQRLQDKISSIMTQKADLVTAPVGVTFEEARQILHKHKIEKLPVVDEQGYLKGLITIKDIEKTSSYPLSTKDSKGRLMVGAAIGAHQDDRPDALIEAGVDVLCIDTAHGYSKNVLNQTAYIKKKFPSCILIAGNVATEEGAEALAKAGADIIKVGMGPGSICTTRIISGVGVPQATALLNCAGVAKKRKVAIIADGGIKYSGDIVKALALGGTSVMIGNLLAGSEESPGETHTYRGRAYKTYRGMGSIEAMNQGSKDRYKQAEISSSEKLVPEGIEGRVPYSGSARKVIHQLVGGLRSGMGYTGVVNIDELQNKSKFIEISHQGFRESHAHDVSVTKEAPNYRME